MSSKRQKESGFVLVLALWVLAAMVLAMGFIASWSEELQERVFQNAQASSWALEQRATQSTLLYLGATRGLSYAGLRTDEDFSNQLESEFNPFSVELHASMGGEIRLDDRPYFGLGSVVFSIQDSGSLVRLSASTESPRLRQLLEQYEIEPGKIDLLLAALADYTDPDNIPSLDGAEVDEYRRNGLLPPTNLQLFNRGQIANVYGWAEALGPDLTAFLSEVSVLSGNNSNFNTLTRRGLASVLESQPHIIESLIAHRENGHFASIAEVNQLSGELIEVDEFEVAMVANAKFRFSFRQLNHSKMQRLEINFRPTSALGPWEIGYNEVRGGPGAKQLKRRDGGNGTTVSTVTSTDLFW